MIGESSSQLEERSPEQVIELAFSEHQNVSISFSGAEDVVLIHMACNMLEDVQVFCLDTGRLHPETYQFIQQVREHYGIDIDVLMPEPKDVEALVREKGLYSFYQDGHQECCSVRKIAPLAKHLERLNAWITGQRRDQSPTRINVPVVQDDTAFSSATHSLKKYNPLANWTSEQVWNYIRQNQVPYNKLHDRGFVSIGCEPCTRAVGPNEHERAGRWWWEESTIKECGLHIINIES